MTDQSFDEFVTELRDDADAATYNLGYMKAILDEPIVDEKLDGSFSGYAMAIATAAVKRSLALYCARAWDKSNDAISLPNGYKRIASLADMRQRWEGWFTGDYSHDRVAKVEASYDRFLKDFSSVQADESHISFRVFRSEWLAHRIPYSNDRRKSEKAGPVDNVTMNQLVSCAEQTVLLVGDLGFLCDGMNNPYPERITRVERHCREFWRVLPVLGKVEDSRFE